MANFHQKKNIALIGPSQKNQHSQNEYVVIPSLSWLSRLQEQNLGQRIWDKVRSYWEQIWEHIKKLEEHVENTLKT